MRNYNVPGLSIAFMKWSPGVTLIGQQTREVLCDNSEDGFLESLGPGFLIQCRNYPKKKVNLPL